MDVQGLTDEEIAVAKLAGQVVFHVHTLCRIVRARAAIRAHPEHWQFK